MLVKFSFSVKTCRKPSISEGSVSPSNETVDYGATYEVTCNSNFTISGPSTMICGANGTFDQTPTCQGNNTNKSAGIKRYTVK